jgi:hypothetical protein
MSTSLESKDFDWRSLIDVDFPNNMPYAIESLKEGYITKEQYELNRIKSLKTQLP